MIRLFISLYVAVVLGLFTINWGSEWLWRQLTPDTHNVLQSTLALAKAVPTMINGEQTKRIEFQQKTGLSLNFLSIDDVAWLAEQKIRLTLGEPVVTYNNQGQPLIYLISPVDTLLYQLGPLPPNDSDSENLKLKYLLLSISYLLLAAFLALWARPVWRDVLQLKTMAKEIANGNLAIENKVNKHSPTAIVVQTFHEMARRISRLLSEQTQLVNAVSHELRTPLSRLRFSLAIMENVPPEQVKEINTDLQEMENLVDEILSYARIETLEQENSKSNVNISELLTNLVEKHQRSTNKRLTITLSDEHINCYCNGFLIERASQNLISNAIRYANNEVIIHAEIKNNQLLISVADDGCGITSADKNKIFDAFTRLDKSRDKQQGGFGLGLAIVKRIMEWHGGSCMVDNSSLGGAKFTLIIEVND